MLETNPFLILSESVPVTVMQGFINFRGREPSLEPLLNQSGIMGKSE